MTYPQGEQGQRSVINNLEGIGIELCEYARLQMSITSPWPRTLEGLEVLIVKNLGIESFLKCQARRTQLPFTE